MDIIDIIAWTIIIAILLSPIAIIILIVKLIKKYRAKRKKLHLVEKKPQEKEWKSEWTWNEETQLWEHPLSKKSDTTYHFTKENIPKEETVQQKQATQNEQPKKDNTPNRVKYEQAPKTNIPNQETAKKEPQPSEKPKTSPRIIYTYSKPTLKPEDKSAQNTEDLDFKNAYQRKSLFTRNEWQNYKKLRDVAEVRGFVICPKVRLFDLVEPRFNKKKKLTYRYKIQAKHVDFVICDRDMNIRAVLELDDSSHYDPERIKRDEFVDTILLSTGYTVIHTKYIDYSILDLI